MSRHLAALNMTQTRSRGVKASADPPIVCDASVRPDANQNYGTMVCTNLRYYGGSAVSIQQFLGIKFRSPAAIVDGDFYATTSPWADVKPQITSTQVDANVFVITAKLYVDGGFAFSATDIFNFGINGDLTKDPDKWTSSFFFAVDSLPDTTGTVDVDVAAAPDSALEPAEQALTLTEGQKIETLSVPPGATTPSAVDAGTYTVAASDLVTPD